MKAPTKGQYKVEVRVSHLDSKREKRGSITLFSEKYEVEVK
jgi:ASC-1-like (ASCH) protein